MQRSHRIRLVPTTEQAQSLAQMAGSARWVWNYALAEVKRGMDAWRAAGKPTGGGPKLEAIKVRFNADRQTLAPWMGEAAHRDCWSQPFNDLHRALRNWRAGRARFPTFKKKGKAKAAFYVANDKIVFSGESVRLPKLGWVRAREALRLRGKILSARVNQDARGDWYCSVAVEGDFEKPRTADKVAGVDLGVKHAVVLSDGTRYDAPKPLKTLTAKLARFQRVVSRRIKGSGRRRKAKQAVGRLYVRIANVRNDWTSKVTTEVCKNHAALGIEDLNVKGMGRNHCLARALSDVSLGEIRRQITYKSETYNVALHVHDRFYPSSQLCSACGHRQKMPLSEREYVCSACGVILDRDVNAARNLVPRATREVTLGDRKALAESKDATKPAWTNRELTACLCLST